MKSKDPLHVTLAKLIALYGRRLLRPRPDGDESPMHQGLARCGRGKRLSLQKMAGWR